MVKFANRAITALFTALLALVLCVVLLCFAGTEFACKRPFVLPQWAMLLIGAAVLGGLTLLVRRGEARVPKRPWLAPCLAGLALLGVQLVLCFHAYFITGWDVRGITESAYAIAGGEADIHAGYLSMYPNNIPLVLIFAAVIRVVRLLLGNPGLDRCIYVLIALQCVLNTLTALLLWRIAAHETGSRRFAWCVAAVYAVLAGLSPWLMIPYSDSMALLFPTAVVAVQQAHGEGRMGWSAWPITGLIAALGYLIKPQAAIAAIAVALLALLWPGLQGGWARTWAKLGCMALAFALLAGPVRQMAVQASPIDVKPERKMGMAHFVMMGLNEETNGIYDYDDVVLSCSAATPEERRALELEEIGRRLSGMTAGELIEHLKKKTLTNFADGTFAWGCEGNFYARQLEDKDALLSPFLKSLTDTGSPRFLYLLTVTHCIWLAVLLGCALCGVRVLSAGVKAESVLPVMMLSLVGLMAFEWIFEARARYLFLYVPFFVMLGMMGWHGARKTV